MKLILNNKIDEAIEIDSFNRNLDINSSEILFNIYFSSNNINAINSMNYLSQYANTSINAYKILNNNDEVMLNVTDADAKLTSFNENFNDNFYSANASIQVME